MRDYPFVLATKAAGACRGDRAAAEGFTKAAPWGEHRAATLACLKAPQSGGGTANLDGATDAGADWLDSLRYATLVGRAGFRQVPHRMQLLTPTAGITAHFRREGAARVPSLGTYVRTTAAARNVAAMTVQTNEALWHPAWSAVEYLRRDMAGACTEAADRALLDTTADGSGDEPAGLLYGVTPISSSGSDPDQLANDIRLAGESVLDAGSSLQRGVWMGTPRVAMLLAMARGAGGAPAFPTVTFTGGTIGGLPFLVSSAAPSDSNGDVLALVDADEVALVSGSTTFRISEHATIEMSTVPEGDAIAVTSMAAPTVSMFQSEASALILSMDLGWHLRRAGMTAYIADIDTSASV